MKTYFDTELGCEVKEFENIGQASEVLAFQLHQEAIHNNEAISTDWDNRGYRYQLINEARALLEVQGHSEVPVMENHYQIRLKAA